MNLKSDILKLSIIFMLILVLIPLASAMDSNDTFYEEYDCSDYEEVVEEYVDYQVEDTQEYQSQLEQDSEIYNNADLDENLDQEDSHYYIEEDSNNVESYAIPEFNEDSVGVIHDAVVIEEDIYYDGISEEIENLCDNINESSDEELTVDENGVKLHESFCYLNNDINLNLVFVDNLFNGMGASNSNFNRSVSKFLELKNNLLTNHEMQMYIVDEGIANLEDIIICMNKITTDFAYSMDNSIAGANDNVIFVNLLSTFFISESIFNAVFSRDLFDVEFLFSGETFFAADFLDMAVEYNFVIECGIFSEYNNLIKFCVFDFGCYEVE